MNEKEKKRRYSHKVQLSLSYYKRNKKLDQRTSLGKALKRVRESLTGDVGGELTEGQSIILDRIIEKLIFLQLISNYALNQSTIINDKGELLPCLGTNYLAYSNALRLDIQAFYNMSDIKTRGEQSYVDIMTEAKKKEKDN